MKFTPYLYFQGQCEAALQFYAECGLGMVSEVMRHEGTPAAAHSGPEWSQKILHCLFQGDAVRFYASDMPESEPMKGCALLIEPESDEAGADLFKRLAEGGRVTVPFEKQFWGDAYGTFTDRFGVSWAINCRAG